MLEEINPASVALGILGGFWGVYVAGTMGAGIVMKIIIFAAITFIGTILSSTIFNK